MSLLILKIWSSYQTISGGELLLLLSLTSVRLEEQNTQLDEEQKHSTCLGTNHAGLTVAMLGVIKPPEK